MQTNTRGGRTFHVTVGASPTAYNGSGINLSNELELVKAALLYGDQAALCSPTCTMLLSVVMLGNAAAEAAPADQLRVFRQVFGSMIDENLSRSLDLFDGLRAKRHRGSKENTSLMRLEKVIAKGWQEARDRLFQMAEGSGLAELLEAQAAGLLELYSANDVPGLTIDNVSDAVMHDFLSRINAAVSGTKSYALLDADAANLMRAQIVERKLSVPDASMGRGRHIALAGDVLRRLPNFSRATLAEIIDIRRELETPLKRFRKTMLDYSDRISCAPWEEAFNAESDRFFIRDIEPAVLELEEAVKSKPYLQALVSRYLRNRKDFIVPLATPAVAAPVLSLFAADTQSLLLIAGSVLVGTAHLSAVLWDVRNEVCKTPQPEQNHLFFYYRAGQMLQ
jgi:hypothetical protein